MNGVEDAAVQWVMELERAAGRDPRDTRYDARSPADLVSYPRIIEVKAFGNSARGDDLWFETRQVDEARRNPEFYLYVVENIRQGDPAKFTLKVLGGQRLASLIARAKKQRYYSVPWPVADYDSIPSVTDPAHVRALLSEGSPTSVSSVVREFDKGGPATGMLKALVDICDRHPLDQSVDAIIREPYVPFIPERGHPGAWNRVLVLGEAQNLSATYDHYVQRLLNGSPRERILRLYWEPQIHVKPWDDGTLKLAMSAAFGCEAENFAVSNAVMWSTKKQGGTNETPREGLRERSAEIWKAMLPILDPTHVVTTGRVASDLMARIKTETGARWVHVRLCSASSLYLARKAATVNENALLEQFPEVAEVVQQHPEYVAKFRRNRIYFAVEAVRAVTR